MMLDDWTLLPYDDLFHLTQIQPRSYERDDNVWIAVTVEMDLNLMTYERQLYTMFDLLSDYGGLHGISFSIFAWFAGAMNFNNFDNMLVSNLFKIKQHSKQTSGE